jgi:hypothetical protein
MAQSMRIPIAHDQVRLAVEDRRDQKRDLLTWVLVVSVRVHNDVCAAL